jgi:hypothetical protein
LRIAAAVALLGLAGCADGTPAKTAAATPASIFSFEIVPLGQADAGDAMLLADLMQKEAARRNLASGAGHPFHVGGVMDVAGGPDGLYVVAVLDINDARGKRLHRIVDDGVRPKARTLDYADLQRLAANAVSKISAWYETSNAASAGAFAHADINAVPSAGIDDTLAAGDAETTGGIDASAVFPSTQPLSFDITMGPAPGDGADALRAALSGVLAKHPQTGGHYFLRGEVAVSTIGNGDMGVSIRWSLRTAEGRLVGIVTQEQAVSPSRIASYWGDLAKDAAEPAAAGIFALLKSGSRLPGNAS